MLAVPASTSSPGIPSTSPPTGPVRNWRSFTCAGQPGRNWPVAGFQADTPSAPPWYSFTARSSARITPATGATNAVWPAHLPEGGRPTAGKRVMSRPVPLGVSEASAVWLPPCSGWQELPSPLRM